MIYLLIHASIPARCVSPIPMDLPSIHQSPATTKAAADITSSSKSFFIFTHGRVQNEQHAGENQQWQREDDGFGVKWHTVKS
jgi:hypothetical protein